MSDCGCDAPKYSAGFCYGMWSGLGCTTRGELWDVNRCGDIIIRYPDGYFKKEITLEVKKPKTTEHYIVKPLMPLSELKKKFAKFRDFLHGIYIEDDKLIIRTYATDEVVAELTKISL